MGMILLMIGNYFHDLAVALMATNVVMIHVVGRFAGEDPVKKEALSTLVSYLSRITWGALVYVLVMGGVRAWFFMDFEWNPAVGRGQIAALVLKHILLIGLTIYGIVGMRRHKERLHGSN